VEGTDGGRLSRPRHCSKGAQPMPKAVYCSDCRDKQDRPRWEVMYSLHCVLNERLKYTSYSTDNSITFYIFFWTYHIQLGHMPLLPTTERWCGPTDVVEWCVLHRHGQDTSIGCTRKFPHHFIFANLILRSFHSIGNMSGQMSLLIQSNISMQHYENVALYVASSLQKDRFWAASLVSGSSRSKENRSSVTFLSHVKQGCSGGLLLKSGGGSKSICFTYASPSIPAMCPNSETSYCSVCNNDKTAKMRQ